ncbi:DUF2029 domain-containing protein [Corynebacterium sp. HS2168-gen11]|uniref:DUF2029 domain-containing protein n=1 Tax=Corynebacterium sp. HS2168-gen11 TaxID=2974027 RepID=UPI00216B4C2C|nr:DUF2029 domain-containing protein [Corynebacterium sp. HS2168-gen11]MCS4535202.1 DUF2029 domain-containing protein [Corynebacterium sp. HS2168-gen11]
MHSSVHKPATAMHIGWLAAVLWIATRVIMLALAAKFPGASGDVTYYFAGITQPDGQSLTEYPVLGLLPIWLATHLPLFYPDHALIAFVCVMLAYDAAFFAFLLSRTTCIRNRILAASFWLIFPLTVGPVFVYRLDVFPAVVVGLGLWALATHPRMAGALFAIATWIKLWPGILVTTCITSWRNLIWLKRFVAFGLTFVCIGICTALLTSPSRMFSPLVYQQDRGLQIESLAATFLLYRAHTTAHDRYSITYAASKSFEITGPGVEFALQMTSIGMLLLVAACCVWALAIFVKGGSRLPDPSYVILSIVLLLIVVNKVFSPQYIIWLGPILAVILLRAPQRITLGLAIATLMVAGISQLIYPVYYDDLLILGESQSPVVILLVVRNIIIVGMTIITVMNAYRTTRAYLQQP